MSGWRVSVSVVPLTQKSLVSSVGLPVARRVRSPADVVVYVPVAVAGVFPSAKVDEQPAPTVSAPMSSHVLPMGRHEAGVTIVPAPETLVVSVNVRSAPNVLVPVTTTSPSMWNRTEGQPSNVVTVSSNRRHDDTTSQVPTTSPPHAPGPHAGAAPSVASPSVASMWMSPLQPAT